MGLTAGLFQPASLVGSVESTADLRLARKKKVGRGWGLDRCSNSASETGRRVSSYPVGKVERNRSSCQLYVAEVVTVREIW